MTPLSIRRTEELEDDPPECLKSFRTTSGMEPTRGSRLYPFPGHFLRRRGLAAAIVVLAIALMSCAGCARKSAHFTLEVDALRQIRPETSAGITYEEDDGVLYVTVVDKHGDGHIHRLILGEVTHAQALELLRQKQAEFERRK